MNTIISKLRSIIWMLYFALAISVCTWFKSESFVLAGDFSWPVYFSNFFHYASYIWDSSVNFGYCASRQLSSFHPYATYGYLLESLIGPGPYVQVLAFYLSYAASGIGMFFLMRKIGIETAGAFIAGVLYMFSPYALAVAWVPAYGIIFPFYCFLPLNLYFFLQFLNHERKDKKICYLVVSCFSYIGVTFSNPAYLIVYMLICTCLGFFQLYNNESSIEKAVNIILYFLFFLLVNSFWIIPLLYDLQGQFSAASNQVASGLISDLGTLKINSVSIISALRMTGIWVIGAEQWGDYYYDWHADASSNAYIFLTMSIPLLAFIRLLFITKHKDKYLFPMLLLLIVGIVLNSGYIAGGVLKIAADIFYYSTFVQRAFRSVFTKFGVILVIPLIYMSSSTLDIFLKRFSVKRQITFSSIIIFIFLFITAKPFFDGRIIKSEGNQLPSYSVKIPEEYYTFKSFSNKKQIDARYLALPIPNSYNQFLQWNESGYGGADFLRNFVDKPLVFANDGSSFISMIIDCINEPADHCMTLLNLANIKYVFQHKDILKIAENTYKTKNKLQNDLFEIIMENLYFELLENRHLNNFLPHIYTAKDIFVVGSQSAELSTILNSSNSDSLRKAILFVKDKKSYDMISNIMIDIAKNSADLDKGATIEYKKINPVKYRIRVHNSNGKLPLVFSEAFDPHWKLYLNKISRTMGQGKLLTEYDILEGNEADQANKNDFQQFISHGYITDTGSEYISKNIQDTIQNNNLPDGSFIETLFKKPIDASMHFLVNGYANSWILDPILFCEGNKDNLCKKNADGTYDFEVIVEFWSQRVFYVGFLISGFTLLSCVAYLIYLRFTLLKKIVIPMLKN